MANPVDDLPIRDLLDLAPLGIMILREGCILSVNRRLAETLGHPQESFTGLTAESAVPLGLSLLFEDYEQLVLNGTDGDIRLRRHRSELPDGSEVHFFENLTDQVRVERERNQLRQRAQDLDPCDPETGLLNRGAILQALETHVSRSRRYGNPLTVVRLTLSPPKPDSPPVSLKSFAQELDAELRWSDQIGRAGETSFLLILPETLRADAEALAAKLGRDRAPLPNSDGWHLEIAVSDWQAGDDTRKLLEGLESRER